MLYLHTFTSKWQDEAQTRLLHAKQRYSSHSVYQWLLPWREGSGQPLSITGLGGPRFKTMWFLPVEHPWRPSSMLFKSGHCTKNVGSLRTLPSQASILIWTVEIWSLPTSNGMSYHQRYTAQARCYLWAQDGQCTYNATLRRVRVTIAVVKP